jgi:hypothetical protein
LVLQTDRWGCCRYSGEGQAANPSHDKDGNELAAAALKKGKAKAESARKQRAFYEKQVQEKGHSYLQDLQTEYAAAEREYKTRVDAFDQPRATNGVNGV